MTLSNSDIDNTDANHTSVNVAQEIQAPEKVSVELVPASQLNVANIFRIIFEAFLSISSASLGVWLGSDNPSTSLQVFTVLFGLLVLVFAILSYIYRPSS